MSTPAFIAYYRVSTTTQGQSGLGLDAQRAAVKAYVQSVGGVLVGEYKEVESGAIDDRMELKAALKQCRTRKAMLVIAKLDRLARSVHFISELLQSGVEFVAADMPHANKLTIHIIAAVAEYEREVIAQRTKASLAAAKARGIRLGNPNASSQSKRASDEARRLADDYTKGILPLIQVLYAQGATSYSRLAKSLEASGVSTQRGGRWTASGVRNIIMRSRNL
ncbi:recombinase family protein [Dyella telluris]|uniref:Recombinase family protein n=1 Tax=Dyella telluris TaxID=2763498 RepID=A0A7G8Q8Y3_9GAMM|nr:recombinase family protein [Dyella telluris]QNK03241.1 recombinase family protein [Dyella telluris]